MKRYKKQWFEELATEAETTISKVYDITEILHVCKKKTQTEHKKTKMIHF